MANHLNIQQVRLFSFVKKTLKKLYLLLRGSFTKKEKKSAVKRYGINLNIGCGEYLIEGFTSLDVTTAYYHSKPRKNGFIEYDMRKDDIPFPARSVDNIYCSHVIEHIETTFVEKFLIESFRVLKSEGVLRIACPNAEFLYHVSSFENNYWKWRTPLFQGKHAIGNIPPPRQLDYFIREISTPRSKYYINKIPHLEVGSVDIQSIPYPQIIEKLTGNLTFRPEHPGDHINAWDFSRLKAIGAAKGFRHIFYSKPGGSISLAMKGRDIDCTHPCMSLYVDMLK